MDNVTKNYLKGLRDKAMPQHNGLEEYLYNASVKHNAMVRQGMDAEYTSIRHNIEHYVCTLIDRKPHVIL